MEKNLEINRKKTIEKLLGKTDDAMSTILVGTNRLASLVTRNNMFDDLLRKSNQQRIAYDEWINGGKTRIKAGSSYICRFSSRSYKIFKCWSR